MKNNKNKLSATEKFQKDIKMIMNYYYRKAISESIKRGIRAKKLSTLKNCNVKRCKV